ncbi:MAG TPA: dioxygenase [Candidatus Limnocylindria bacterium]|nr:dioxygenase [Candidatus Limnocylindria bacterium]
MANAEDRSRRRFFKFLLSAPIAYAIGSQLPWPDLLGAAETKPGTPGSSLAPTPECADDDEPTPSETAGPFFTPNSPRRTSLIESGVSGTKVVLTGRVFSRECRPLPGVLVDFWQADDAGEYDNEGFKLRGHQFTDATGLYRLTTIVPGLYPGRTRHIHARVQAPKQRVLTTQLYLPDEPRNRRDFLFRPDLLMAVKNGAGGKQARFHFMLDMA